MLISPKTIAMPRGVSVLYYIAITAAAFTTFFIQPVVGKLVLPRFGGSTASWLTSVAFFQTTLLSGYILAYFLTKRSMAIQRRAVVVLAIVAPLSLRLPLVSLDSDTSALSLLSALLLSLTVQILFTTAVGLVFHGWILKLCGKVPYHLYAVSNLSSLGALLAYPFLVEPFFGLDVQIIVLRVSTIALSLACLGLALTQPDHNPQDELAPSTHEPLSIMRKSEWLFLSFLNCVLMMSATRILGAEFGSNPLTWIIPLGLYLASFTVAFSNTWGPKANFAALIILCATLPLFALKKGVMSVPLSGATLAALVVLVATGTLVANGMIYNKRPERDFASYYLVIALGGALGGFFASFCAPVIFSRNYEFLGSISIITLIAANRNISVKGFFPRLGIATLLFAPILTASQEQIASDNRGGIETLVLRNYYGSIILRSAGNLLKCASETTLHGSQFLDPAHRDLPTAYYAEGSAIGIIIRSLQRENPQLNIGVVGLGAGTLAAYVRPSDSILFWEINPQMKEVALDVFSYLRRCKGRVEIRMTDGRLGLKAYESTLNMLVIDAFSGDSVPLHLLTREAMREYHSKTPNGIIAVNISNRYVDLFPVLAAHAKALGLQARALVSAPPAKPAQDELLSTPSRYVIISSAAVDAQIKSLIADAPPRTGWSYRSRKTPTNLIDWTDSRHSILDVLDLRAALRGEAIDSGKL